MLTIDGRIYRRRKILCALMLLLPLSLDPSISLRFLTPSPRQAASRTMTARTTTVEVKKLHQARARAPRAQYQAPTPLPRQGDQPRRAPRRWWKRSSRQSFGRGCRRSRRCVDHRTCEGAIRRLATAPEVPPASC